MGPPLTDLTAPYTKTSMLRPKRGLEAPQRPAYSYASRVLCRASLFKRYRHSLVCSVDMGMPPPTAKALVGNTGEEKKRRKRRETCTVGLSPVGAGAKKKNNNKRNETKRNEIKRLAFCFFPTLTPKNRLPAVKRASSSGSSGSSNRQD